MPDTKPTYSYDPTKITAHGLDQMRFELGDTVVDMGPITSPLCDEEYQAVLGSFQDIERQWRQAKIKCLEAIMMKLAYEVDTSVGGLSYSLNQRFDRWKKLLDDERKEAAALNGVPVAGDPGSLSPNGLTRTPYYHNDMQANWRKFGRWW